MSLPVSKKDAKRTRVLEAARRRFGRHGIRATTMQDIAAEAGVAVGTIYRFFPDKDSLVLAWVEEHRQLLDRQFAESLPGPGPASEKLRTFLRLRFEVVRQVREEPAIAELTRAVQRLAPGVVPEMTFTVLSHLRTLAEEGRRTGEFPSVSIPHDTEVLLLALSGFFTASDDPLTGPPAEEAMLKVADWIIAQWKRPGPAAPVVPGKVPSVKKIRPARGSVSTSARPASRAAGKKPSRLPKR